MVITGLDQDPPVLTGTGQRESPGELAALQNDGQMVGLIADDLSGALIPDDHRAGAACLSRADPFIVARGQGVVLHRHRQSPDLGIQRRSLGNRPRPKDPADQDPEIEMQRRRVMKLYHKTRHSHGPILAASMVRMTRTWSRPPYHGYGVPR